MTYRFVDCLKFFFCLCVIAIHCESLADVDPDVRFFVTQDIFRLAVPFFFVASGYFFGRKINVVLQSIKMSPYTSGPVIFKEIIRHVVFYPWGALWFVQTCIVGMLLLYPFVKKRRN